MGIVLNEVGDALLETWDEMVVGGVLGEVVGPEGGTCEGALRGDSVGGLMRGGVADERRLVGVQTSWLHGVDGCMVCDLITFI